MKQEHATGAPKVTGPLAGIRVVDISTTILGPYATQMLGDLGADVIKIEGPPDGDIARNMGVFKRAGLSGTYMNINRNKRSVALDLKNEKAKEVVHRLVANADVFVHNMRLQAIERLGLGYSEVSAIKPDIVYAMANGFGQDGPYRDKTAFDDVIQACSGTASMFARRDGVASYVPTAMADKIAGLFLTQAVMAALVHKERTSEGQYVEVPMYETMVAFNLAEHLSGAAYIPPLGKVGYARAMEPSRRPFKTRDGFVCILPYNDKQWERFFSFIGRLELKDDPRFATYSSRALNLGSLYGEIESRTPSKTTAEWVELCDREQIPCMPVVDMDDLPKDAHLKAVGMFEQHLHPTEGPTQLVRSPLKFSRTQTAISRHAPMFGENTISLLEELGYGGEAIDSMLKDSIAFKAKIS